MRKAGNLWLCLYKFPGAETFTPGNFLLYHMAGRQLAQWVYIAAVSSSGAASANAAAAPANVSSLSAVPFS